MTYTNTTGGEPKVINLKELDGHIRNLKRPAYGFFVSQKVWDGLKEKLPQGALIWGSPMMVDPELADERFDIAFTQESFDRRAKDIRDRQPR